MTENSNPAKCCSQTLFPKTAPIRGLLFCAALCCSHLVFGQGRQRTLPDGEGKQLVAFACSQCHGLQETLLLRDGRKGWEDVVDRMVLYGAQLSPSDAELVTRYLATQLGPRTSPVPSGATQPQGATGRSKKIPLPSGPGKDLVAERCAMCHGLERVVATTRSKADWESITHDMVQRGMRATPDETRLMLSYLEAHFGR